VSVSPLAAFSCAMVSTLLPCDCQSMCCCHVSSASFVSLCLRKASHCGEGTLQNCVAFRKTCSQLSVEIGKASMHCCL
jgi:hypothetical protein